jgi:hypothetical protein
MTSPFGEGENINPSADSNTAAGFGVMDDGNFASFSFPTTPSEQF